MTEPTTAYNAVEASTIVAEIMKQHSNLGYVALGGILGGLLQPIVATLNPNSPNPVKLNWLFSPILGVAAAGITVYVVAKTNTTDTTHLLFFSLLCGLAFPAILSSAVDQMSKRTEQAKKETGVIATESKAVAAETAPKVADEIKMAVVNNPAGTLTVSGQAEVEKSITQTVRNISEAAPQHAAQAMEIAKKLSEVATVAETAGYSAAAVVATDKAAEMEQAAGEMQVAEQPRGKGR